MLNRPRRNRSTAAIRTMVEENRLSVKDLLFPLFVMDGSATKTEIKSMPGIYRYTTDL
jgi:porphobilinogen synthase